MEVVCFVGMADDSHALATFLVTQKLAEVDARVSQDVQLDICWYGRGGCYEGNLLWPC